MKNLMRNATSAAHDTTQPNIQNGLVTEPVK